MLDTGINMRSDSTGKGAGIVLLKVFRFVGENSGVSAEELGCIPFDKED